MKWVKRGLIYNVVRKNDWYYSHAHKPTPLLIDV